MPRSSEIYRSPEMYRLLGNGNITQILSRSLLIYLEGSYADLSSYARKVCVSRSMSSCSGLDRTSCLPWNDWLVSIRLVYYMMARLTAPLMRALHNRCLCRLGPCDIARGTAFTSSRRRDLFSEFIKRRRETTSRRQRLVSQASQRRCASASTKAILSGNFHTSNEALFILS